MFIYTVQDVVLGVIFLLCVLYLGFAIAKLWIQSWWNKRKNRRAQK